MTQQTWLGSDLVSDVLLSDIPDNETELFTRVEALETEVEDARDGESTLLAKQQAQDVILDVILDEVVAARDGEDSLLEKEQAQDIATALVTAEVTAARDGFASLLAKEQEQDTKIAAAQVLVTIGYPSQTGKSGYSLSTDGTMPEWVDRRNTFLFSYDDRDQLRSLNPVENVFAVVEELGLFIFSTTSAEPDDDESCFTASTGQWLLEAPHYSLLSAWAFPDTERNKDDFNEVFDQLAGLEMSVLFGTITCGVTSIATVTSTAFSGTVVGAAVGDRVFVVPPAALGTDAASTGRLSFHAYVSAVDTVTVQLCNASAATATTNAAIQTSWPVMVVKEI